MSSPISFLTKPLQLFGTRMKNRIVMSPMTRNRGQIPVEHNVDYYVQRSGAGLIITEGTLIEPQGSEWPQAPGLWTSHQVRGWRRVVDAVHDAPDPTAIFCQLWHIGRVAHPLAQAGQPNIGPSPIAAAGGKFRQLAGAPGYVTPQEMTTVDHHVETYGHSAALCKKAGFDGVEMHCANGYLLHQFLDASSNQRKDDYGGSAEKRCRFPLECIDAVADVFGPNRVGVRISPSGGYNDMGFEKEDTIATYSYFLRRLSEMGIAFIDYVRFKEDGRGTMIQPNELKKYFKGLWFLNGGFDVQSGEEALRNEEADAIVYARHFISNPDLPYRIQHNIPLAKPDPATFYWDMKSDPRVGYTDYPFAEGNPQQQKRLNSTKTSATAKL